MLLVPSSNDQVPFEVSASGCLKEFGVVDHQDSHPPIVSVTPTKVQS